MKDSLFKDVRDIEREDDALQKNYSTKEIVERVWRENLYPRRKLVALAVTAMLFAAATTGLMVPAIKFAIDDIFVARKWNLSIILPARPFSLH